MALPRDFSEDGAIGAGTATVGSQTGGFQQSDAGMNGAPGSSPQPQWETGQQAQDDYAKYMENSYAGGQAAMDQGGYQVQTGGPGGLKFRKNSAQQDADYLSYENHMNGTVTPGISDPGKYSSGPNGFSYSSFEDGGAVDDGGGDDGSDSNDGNGALPHSMDGLQGAINKALEVVDNALSYGRKLHGLPDGGGGVKQDDQAGAAGDAANPRFQDFNKSPNVTDRRDERFWNPLKPAVGPVNNFIGKAYSLYDRAVNPDDPVDKNNQMATELGGHDLAGGQQHQNFQDNLADQQGEGAIPDNDEDDK